MIEKFMRWWYGYLPPDKSVPLFILDIVIHGLVGIAVVLSLIHSLISFFK